MLRNVINWTSISCYKYKLTNNFSTEKSETFLQKHKHKNVCFCFACTIAAWRLKRIETGYDKNSSKQPSKNSINEWDQSDLMATCSFFCLLKVNFNLIPWRKNRTDAFRSIRFDFVQYWILGNFFLYLVFSYNSTCYF